MTLGVDNRIQLSRGVGHVHVADGVIPLRDGRDQIIGGLGIIDQFLRNADQRNVDVLRLIVLFAQVSDITTVGKNDINGIGQYDFDDFLIGLDITDHQFIEFDVGAAVDDMPCGLIGHRLGQRTDYVVEVFTHRRGGAGLDKDISPGNDRQHNKQRIQREFDPQSKHPPQKQPRPFRLAGNHLGHAQFVETGAGEIFDRIHDLVDHVKSKPPLAGRFHQFFQIQFSRSVGLERPPVVHQGKDDAFFEDDNADTDDTFFIEIGMTDDV